MAETFTILFNSGQRSGDLEAKIAPAGTLSKVTNLIQEKDGSWVKRKEYRELSIDVTDRSILAISQRKGEKIVVVDNPPQLYKYKLDDETLVEVSDGYIGLPSFSAPERLVVANSLERSILRADSAVCNGILAVVYQERFAIKAKIYDAETRTLLKEQTILDDENLVAGDPQIVATDRYIIILFTQTALGIATLRKAILDTHDSGVPAFSAQTQVALLDSLRGPLSGFGACSVGDAVYAPVQTDENTLSVIKLSPPFVGFDDVEISDGTDTVLLGTCWGSTEANRLWVSWRRADEDRIRIVSISLTDFDNATPTATKAINVDEDNIGRPALVGYSADSVMLAWNSYDISGPDGSRINWCTVDSSDPPIDGTTYKWEGVNFCSHLFAGTRGYNYEGNTSTSEVYAVCFGDSGVEEGVDPQTRNFHILRFDLEGTGSRSSVVQMQLGDQLAPHMQTMLADSHLGHVIQDADTGAFHFAAPIVFRGLPNDPDAAVGISLYTFDNSSASRCQSTEHGGNLYFTGGIVTKYDGNKAVEAGFLRAPDILIADGYESDSGELSLLGLYTYAAVYERVDNDNGNVVRSNPSFLHTVTLTDAQNSAYLTIRDLKVRQDGGEVAHVHIYRSLANGSTLFRITPEVGLPAGTSLDTAGHIVYLDELSDSELTDDQIIYTQVGDTLGNYPPPPCRYMFSCLPRLWCLGLEDNEMVECSKEYFHGEEPAQFTRHPAFRIHMPGKVLGGGSLKSNPIIFTRDKVVLVTGDGPDDSGAGAFDTEIIASESGLVEWGHRAIIETARGLIFQSQPDRIDLITTGYEAPSPISEPVRDVLEEFPYVTSSVLVNDERELRFTCLDDLDNPSSGVILNYDLERGQWSVRDDGYFSHGTIWDGAYALAKNISNDDSLVIERNTYENEGVMCIETADLYVSVNGGPGNRWLRCRKFAPLFEYISQCAVTVEFSIDGGVNWVDSGNFELTDNDYEVGEAVTIWFHVATQKSDRIRVRLKCFTAGGESFQTGRGVKFLGLSMEMRGKAGPKRVAASGRR